MSATSRFRRITNVFNTIGDAIAVSNAVRENRRPAAHNLRGLGIDPTQFDNIGKF